MSLRLDHRLRFEPRLVVSIGGPRGRGAFTEYVPLEHGGNLWILSQRFETSQNP